MDGGGWAGRVREVRELVAGGVRRGLPGVVFHRRDAEKEIDLQACAWRSSGLLRFVGGAAAGFCRSGGIDSAVALLDVGDLAVFVDHESGAIRHSGLFDQNAIRLRHSAIHEIAEEWDGDVVLGRELALRRGVVGADPEDLGSGLFKFCDTSLVRGEFLRSATGESGRIERQNDDVFAAEVGELDAPALRGRQGEIGSFVADLKLGFGRLHGLREERGSGEHSQDR